MILANGRLRLIANAVELLEDPKIAEIYFGARSTAEKS